MAFTNNTATILNGKTDNKEYWCASVYADDISTKDDIKASPGAGYALCVERIDIFSQTDTTVTIQQGTGPTIIAGPIPLNADGGGQYTLEFLRPIELPADTALDALTALAATISIVAQGFTRKTS